MWQGELPFHGGGRDSSQPGKNQQQTRGGPSSPKNSAGFCVVPPRRRGATENIGETLQDIWTGKDFLEKTLEAQAVKAKINIWDCIKLRSFCTAKKVRRVKRQPTEWEKIFANYATDKGLITGIYKEIKKLHNNKTNNPLKRWAKDLNRHFSKEHLVSFQVEDHRTTVSLTQVKSRGCLPTEEIL
uniref:Uncharacterized protein n=1 Tax=Oryctolagus cuniculus TaxID=9986 RepID=A0A5F9DTG2_RABIT